MQNKIWKYRDEQLKKEDIEAFSKSYNLAYPLAALLMCRGIKSDKDAKAFMQCGLEGIHNPFMLNDMDKACDRIIKAIENKEKITVYGDYDVDGITSTTVLTDFLESVGASVDYYIPNRFNEGYGINILAINKISKSGTKLLVSVDCGISSIGEVEFAKTQGLDVVITDHHTCRENLPRAIAVINPKREDSTYPFSELAGVGVAFKLVLALAKKMGLNTKEFFLKYVELVTIGTIADVVPLKDENRIIVSRGLAAIENTENCGIKALLEAAGVKDKKITSTVVAFSLAPRLNAAGRMESAVLSVELLKEKNLDTAKQKASKLEELNIARRSVEQQIYKEAVEMAESYAEQPQVYVLTHEDWHDGVIGIAASKLCEKFYRPCILLSENNGKCKGSGRSIEGMNLFYALADSEEYLTAYGGHALAAGLSITKDNVPSFTKKINEYAKKLLTGDVLTPKLLIDCKLPAEYITVEWAKLLNKFEPFGCGNEQPIFSVENAVVSSIFLMGNEKQHISLKLKANGMEFTAVGFGMSNELQDIKIGDRVSIAFTLNINVYQGKENIQLFIKDVKR